MPALTFWNSFYNESNILTGFITRRRRGGKISLIKSQSSLIGDTINEDLYEGLRPSCFRSRVRLPFLWNIWSVTPWNGIPSEVNPGSDPVRRFSSPLHPPSSSSQQQFEVCEKCVTQQNFDASERIRSFVCFWEVWPNSSPCCLHPLHHSFPAGTLKEKLAIS